MSLSGASTLRGTTLSENPAGINLRIDMMPRASVRDLTMKYGPGCGTQARIRGQWRIVIVDGCNPCESKRLRPEHIPVVDTKQHVKRKTREKAGRIGRFHTDRDARPDHCLSFGFRAGNNAHDHVAPLAKPFDRGGERETFPEKNKPELAGFTAESMIVMGSLSVWRFSHVTRGW
jgi:hypothetical protein